ncbi:GntR family transcriptional regulator [Paenibacillus cymbidii]|uniref:GntR family transcriptional regulator n=1 Tax=Paenibacillus cymbidii TaxID=1639034 RepID=UPI001080E42E|nr:GntR family transcriptional regulator [Paenibacillus cymbidii]
MLKKSADRFSRSLFARDILQHLRLGIITGELKANHRLVESQLAEEYGVSRGPVRSAIHALEQQGLVRSLPSGGAEVVGFSQKHAIDLFIVRTQMEQFAAQLMMQRSDLDTGILHSITNDMANEPSIEKLHDLDMQFHLEFMKLADNWALLQSWVTLSPIISDMLTFTNSLFKDYHLVAANHKQYVEFIEKRQLEPLLHKIVVNFEFPKKLISERFGGFFADNK